MAQNEVVKRHQHIHTPNVDQVGSLARSGSIWSLALVVSRQIMTLCSSAILSRILTSSDFGLMAMITTLTVLLGSVSEMGLSWATVQRKEISQDQVSTLYWVNVLAGGLLWIFCFAVSPVVATFYGREELDSIISIISATFLVGSFATQPSALLVRQLRFRLLSLCEIGAVALGTVSAITMAFHGAGYWALVAQALAYSITRTTLITITSGFRPNCPRPTAKILTLLKFGGCLSLNNLNVYFTNNLDNVLIGRSWGASELGFYSRAYYLMLLPTTLASTPFDRVMIPTLSALRRNPERMAYAYKKAVSLIAFMSFPISSGLAVTSTEAIQLIYGPDWLPVAPILFWLSISGLLQPVYNTQGWLYISTGKGREFFCWSSVAAVAMSAGFILGVRWGSLGVAVVYAAVMTILTIPALYLAHRAAGLSLWPTLRPIAPTLASAIAMAIIVWITGQIMYQLQITWFEVLIAKVVIGFVVYLSLCRRFVKPLPFSTPEWFFAPIRHASPASGEIS